jgi:hypothetical protein
MKPPDEPTAFTRIVNQKRYSTKTATMLAGDDYWDGHNWERQGRQCWLYKTPNGAYFTVNLTRWQGERDTLTPVTLEEAIDLYEGGLTEHRVSYGMSFPNVSVEEA